MDGYRPRRRAGMGIFSTPSHNCLSTSRGIRKNNKQVGGLMSGGRFGYSQHRLFDIVEGIKEIIEHNTIPDEWGNANNFSDETIEEFRKGIEILNRAYVYAQRIDWLVSGDDSEPYFHKRLQEDLKELNRD
jgi:hypothetical protein